MASHALNTQSFIKKLLAPLPDGEEKADSKEFRRQIKADVYRIWDAGMVRVSLAAANHAAGILHDARTFGRGEPFSQKTEQAMAEAHAAHIAQCLIPAPSMKEVRWKLRFLKSCGDRAAAQAIASAIEADQRRLLASA